jgi:hypothetical protein
MLLFRCTLGCHHPLVTVIAVAVCSAHPRSDAGPDPSGLFAMCSQGRFDELDHGTPLERLFQKSDRSRL